MHGEVYIDRKNGINNIEALMHDFCGNMQVQFHAEDDDYMYGGIWVPELEKVICGECGGSIGLENVDYLYVYFEWYDITEAVTGFEAESWENIISE
jgi:hypothetical protein